MARRDRIEVLREGLEDHPAVRAWRRLAGAGAAPLEVHVLKAKPCTAAYRIPGAGPTGTTVIAKWSRHGEAELERTLYENVLPHLPVPTPDYFGAVDEADGEHCWLFIEDAGTRHLDRDDPTHRALAARWLGRMQTAAVDVQAAAGLPRRGPEHYLEHLRSARSTLRRSLANPALDAGGTAMLERAIDCCDLAESRWDLLGEMLAGAPVTLVHGDFVPKNICLRDRDGGPELLPLDWGECGRGVPTADLGAVDLDAYGAVVREAWPEMDGPTLERLANVGRLFRSVAAVDWVAPYFELAWLDRAIRRLQVHVTELDAAMSAVGWSCASR